MTKPESQKAAADNAGATPLQMEAAQKFALMLVGHTLPIDEQRRLAEWVRSHGVPTRRRNDGSSFIDLKEYCGVFGLHFDDMCGVIRLYEAENGTGVLNVKRLPMCASRYSREH